MTTTAATISLRAGTDDPFALVLASLQDSSGKILLLEPALGDADTAVNDIEGLMRALGECLNVFEVVHIEKLIAAVGDAISFLTPVPVVGEVADALSGVINTASATLGTVEQTLADMKKTLIDPVVKALDDARKGLDKARQFVQTAGQQVPQYLNTLSILNYLADIATPLVQVLQGGEAGTRLGAVLDNLNKARSEAAKVLTPLADTIASVTSGAQDFAKTVKAALDTIGADARGKLEGLKHAVDDIVRPVHDAFDKVVNAIKPLASPLSFCRTARLLDLIAQFR